jgi:hypothetical protein
MNTSNVEVAEAAVVPVVSESHRSYETSATRPEDAEEERSSSLVNSKMGRSSGIWGAQVK